jgi:hypothetical protein
MYRYSQAYATSLFERLQTGGGAGRRGHPVVSLTVQHRWGGCTTRTQL